MKTTQHFIAPLMALAILAMSVGLASANDTIPPSEGPAEETSPITDCTSFDAKPGNLISSPEFEVVRSSDGVIVQGVNVVVAGEKLRGIEWEVDLKNCTYLATEASNAGTPRVSETIVENTNPRLAQLTGSYFAGVWVVTKDPPGYWLASTLNKLWWNTYSNGTVQWTQHGKACTGHTTPLNTHWYVVSPNGCQWGSPWYSSGTQSAFTQISGDYYNYDFGNPSQRTDARHFSQIEGRNNGTWVHSWSATHWGEYSGLLRGETIPAGP
jgi:hypothetical protein